MLGPLTEDLAGLQGRNSGMFGGGWYGYVDKDLRTLLGSGCAIAYNLRYCGDGSLTRVPGLAVGGAQGSGGRARRRPGPGSHEVACGRDGGAAQVRAGAALDTMRFTNRSTFQQVLRFGR